MVIIQLDVVPTSAQPRSFKTFPVGCTWLYSKMPIHTYRPYLFTSYAPSRGVYGHFTKHM